MNFTVCLSSNSYIYFLGNVYNRLILCKTLIARELACCKIFVRHLALRKLWPTILPIEGRGGILWNAMAV